MSDRETTSEDDRILRSARRPIAHVALGPEGDRLLFHKLRERQQQQRRARAAKVSRAFTSEAAASAAMATAAQQSSQASSSGTVGSTIAQTLSQFTDVMASQPIVLTPEEVAIQQAALQEAQLHRALGEIKAEKEKMIRRRARIQRRQADVSELEGMDLTYMDDNTGVKHALTHHEVLKLPDPDKPFVVTTDASQYGIGAVLAQHEGKKLRPIKYMSKNMPSQKLAKSTYEKELYAIYKASTHWRHYLLGRFFYVRTDHQTLRWMKTRPVLSDALKRWIEVIEQYNFEPQYIKGEYNKVADALSHRPDFLGALVTEFGLADDVIHSLVEAYHEDPFMAEIIRRLEAKYKATADEFVLVNGLLFLEKAGNKCLCVPNWESLRSLFLGECHNATRHFRYRKTAANLLQRFWSTTMRDAKLYVETSQVCQRDKPCTQAPLGLLKPLPIPERPGESLSMDFMETLVTSKSRMRYVYVIVDRFSNYARLVAMPATAKTEYVIKSSKENWVRDFGLPKSIVSDRDVRFTSELWKAAAAEQGTHLQMTSGNHPAANGQAEQLNRVVQHLLRHYIKPNQVEWDEKLALIASLYNNVVHSATGVSPNSLLLTFKPRLPLDFLLPENQPTAAPGTLEFEYRYEQLMQQAVEQMHKAQAAMIESESKHSSPSTVQVGDRVWVKSSELGQEHGISPASSCHSTLDLGRFLILSGRIWMGHHM
ncbi:hypothetical protein CBR_g70714 [Chara braunii]|uniref:Integrase catalytic domain-containing protein n=1 Tax=Chara braunii TaxID=69332 RepID=A0A388K9Y6_CHABU|nr:hypothetical protein CBR_g70714 [Chara braunii]|eukprot:GBG66836.1 hypothetical protein CBR_g70714 [Chara braunii]